MGTLIAFVIVFGGTTIICFVLTDMILDGKLSSAIGTFKERNSLRECTKCERLYRKYQMDLVKEAKESEDCPHCGRYIFSERKVKSPDKWMDTHSDCPKINLISYVKILRAMKSVAKINKEKASIERFEKYNNLKVDVDWITKLQKDLGK